MCDSTNQTCKQSNRKVIDWSQLRCNSNRLKFFKCNSNSNRLKFYLLHLLLSIIFLLQNPIFKTLVLVYKYFTTGQPKYFAPYLPLYKSAVNTRRSNPKNLFLLVPSYCPSIHKSKVHFNNSFSYDAPKLWNDLPYDIRSAPNLSSFKSRLKTYLFQKSFPP